MAIATELQKDNFILPGNLGYLIDPAGNRRPILKVFKKRNGSTTITIGTAASRPLPGSYEIDEKTLNATNAQKDTLRP